MEVVSLGIERDEGGGGVQEDLFFAAWWSEAVEGEGAHGEGRGFLEAGEVDPRARKGAGGCFNGIHGGLGYIEEVENCRMVS